jgi:hypothetical protein
MIEMKTLVNSYLRIVGGVLLMGALLTLSAAALQQVDVSPPEQAASRITIVPRGTFSVRIWTDRTAYRLGDPVRVYFRVTRNAYVYIFDTEPDGVTHQILPNFYDQENYVRGGITYSIPDASYELRVTGPAGWETLRIVAVEQRCWVLDEYERGFRRSAPFPERPAGATALREKLERYIDQSKTEPSQLRREGELKIAPYPYPYVRPYYCESSTSFEVLGGYRVREPQREDFGELTITSKPSGARVYVDGSYEGTTPQTLDLSSGSHEVVLVKPGYESWRTTVFVDPGGRQRLKARLVPHSWTPWRD